MNGDGASCSREVELPEPLPIVPCPRCYAMTAELARYRRLLQDAEHRVGLGRWASSVIDPFGTLGGSDE